MLRAACCVPCVRRWYGESEGLLAKVFRAAEALGGAIIFLVRRHRAPVGVWCVGLRMCAAAHSLRRPARAVRLQLRHCVPLHALAHHPPGTLRTGRVRMIGFSAQNIATLPQK